MIKSPVNLTSEEVEANKQLAVALRELRLKKLDPAYVRQRQIDDAVASANTQKVLAKLDGGGNSFGRLSRYTG